MIFIMCQDIQQVFRGGQVLWLEKGETVFRAGEPVHRMYLLMDGGVDLVRHTETGLRMTLHHVTPGQVLAEASAYSPRYHCDGTAPRTAQLCAIAADLFHTRLAEDPKLARVWAARLAHALQGARMNAEIRSLKTVSERLDVWLSGQRPLPPKGQWQNLADSLGVSREALYRELAKRR